MSFLTAISRSSNGLFFSHQHYVVDLLQPAGMAECHPCSIPTDTQAKLSDTYGKLVYDIMEYMSLAGALHYLTLTRI
jgi:hypothetical protein